ncbi:hypothetical protein N473_18220 [Pseudoalteromonas luteoviolacea CPMOR-1]|uniref:Uncharacterized protein n=1 Tax=Pseudoalteromonas luteoviolacea CPMOR-1 TaxID=1365248 RepID=A0A162BJ04_9GAMM|nr:hypothetical protein N473_18220 [Pseudoalteromonas luteoviolacea CPMOR-1]
MTAQQHEVVKQAILKGNTIKTPTKKAGNQMTAMMGDWNEKYMSVLPNTALKTRHFNTLSRPCNSLTEVKSNATMTITTAKASP